eukprot:792315-Pyramimonas_sp.AAC.1
MQAIVIDLTLLGVTCPWYFACCAMPGDEVPDVVGCVSFVPDALPAEAIMVDSEGSTSDDSDIATLRAIANDEGDIQEELSELARIAAAP